MRLLQARFGNETKLEAFGLQVADQKETIIEPRRGPPPLQIGKTSRHDAHCRAGPASRTGRTRA